MQRRHGDSTPNVGGKLNGPSASWRFRSIGGLNARRSGNGSDVLIYVYRDMRAGKRMMELTSRKGWVKINSMPDPRTKKEYPVYHGKIIFWCAAKDIEEADQRMEAATGIELASYQSLHILTEFYDQ